MPRAGLGPHSPPSVSLAVLVLLILTLRRHHKSHLSSDEDEDMRDNVIKYNDEGGGEQDTEAYDMSALRSLYDFGGELKGGDGGGGPAGRLTTDRRLPGRPRRRWAVSAGGKTSCARLWRG